MLDKELVEVGTFGKDEKVFFIRLRNATLNPVNITLFDITQFYNSANGTLSGNGGIGQVFLSASASYDLYRFEQASPNSVFVLNALRVLSSNSSQLTNQILINWMDRGTGEACTNPINPLDYVNIFSYDLKQGLIDIPLDRMILNEKITVGLVVNPQTTVTLLFAYDIKSMINVEHNRGSSC